MNSVPKRPWYRLHWVTWVVILLVIAALAYREQVAQRFDGGWVSTDQATMDLDELRFGWPYAHLIHYDFGSASMTSGWHWGWFGVNVVCCLLLTVFAASVVETRLRGPTPRQITIRFLLVVVAIAGVLMGLALQPDGWLVIMDFFGGVPATLVSWEGFTNPVLWPMQFALACMIYALGWLALALLRRAYRLARP